MLGESVCDVVTSSALQCADKKWGGSATHRTGPSVLGHTASQEPALSRKEYSDV
jgi:hypothetical protein